MHTVNKNKKLLSGHFILSLVIIVASFLLLSPNYLLAQSDNTNNANTTSEDITSNTNSNTNTAPTTDTDTAEEESDNVALNMLNKELDEKRELIEELGKKVDVYEENIKIKQQEEVTLNNQISLLQLQIEQGELDIERVQEEISKVSLEIERLGYEIEDQESSLVLNKEVLASYIRLIDRYDQRSYLDILVSNESFSDFFDQLQYAENLESQVGETVVEVRIAKEQLEVQEEEKVTKKTELDELSSKLATSIVSMGGQKDYKDDLLLDTQESESKFEALLEESRQEQEAVASEISSLESKAREKLEGEGIDLNIDAVLMWPVSPTRGVSAYFHDPDYPFRRYFEHPAIDIPQPQGSVVRASENGYIVRAKNAGLGYSYIMIVHNSEMSTVYGHISRIDVAEDDYVVRGQQIGLSGGLPGTSGSGRLTTGAHLHFEVRSDGIPVNPLDYLPAL